MFPFNCSLAEKYNAYWHQVAVIYLSPDWSFRKGPIFCHLPKTEVWWQIYNSNFVPISNIIFKPNNLDWTIFICLLNYFKVQS